MTKLVYLTIDDSPSEDMQKKVDFLYEKQIPAVWFCIGNLIRKRPQPVIDAIRKGFIIGNHSFSHPHFSDLTMEQAFEEIRMTDWWVDKMYEEAGVSRNYKFFRFPYGDKGDLRRGKVFESLTEKGRIRKQIIQAVLYYYGYSQPAFNEVSYQYMKNNSLLSDIDWHWTYDIMEWATFEKKPTFGVKNLEAVLNRLNEKKPADCRGKIYPEEPRSINEGTSSEIILLHDHEQTTPIFQNIISRLEEKKVVFQRI
jgi:peptidoglycan/xylan/chitin deacetylase (PgdA/CDA1 family)